MPGPELDVRPLGERLEALEPEGEEARLGGRGRRRVIRRLVRSGAATRGRLGRRAAGPSPGRPPRSRPTRRDGPSPTPSSSPSTQTSIRNELLVVGPGRVDEPVRRPVAGPALGVLLEPALGALERADRRLGVELRVGQPDEPVADRLEAEVEVERARDGLEGRREERRPPPAAALAPRPRRAGGTRRGRSGRRGGPARRSTRWPRGGRTGRPRRRRVAGVERLGDGQVDDGVTEELEAFVVAARGIAVLVVPARVDERLLEQVEVPDREPDPRREGLGGSHAAVVRPTPVGAARRSARRCSRRRPGRCGSSPRPRPRSPSRTPLRGS